MTRRLWAEHIVTQARRISASNCFFIIWIVAQLGGLLSQPNLSLAALTTDSRSPTAIWAPFAPKPSRLELRLDGQVSFAFGIDHEKTALPLAHARCFNSLQRFADQVQHAA